jgi:hypothetical protein
VEDFPPIAKPNMQARCENFHLTTIFENTRCELAIELAFAMSEKEPLFREKICVSSFHKSENSLSPISRSTGSPRKIK